MSPSPFLGELLGTTVLMLLGDGVVANVVLKQTKGNSGGWIVIATGWGLAVLMGIFTAKLFGSPEAHINPAVTLGNAVLSGDYSNVLGFITAQMIGAFLGAVLVWIHYMPHWAATEDPADKLACFATGPAIRATGPNFVSEVLATVFLIVGLSGIGHTEDVPPGLGPYLVGMLVWSIGLSLGGPTGYAVNPARDLGPRVAHALLPIAGKGSSDWAYGWIPVVGPFVGAALAALLLGMVSL